MNSPRRSLYIQFLAGMVSALVFIFVLIQFNVLGRIVYSIESGRLAAIKEHLPSDPQLAEFAHASRLVAQMVTPAVVAIHTTASPSFGQERNRDLETAPDDAPQPRDFPEGFDEDEFRRYHPEIVRQGMGSGVVVDAQRGIIVTNNHVIEAADHIWVTLSDGRRFRARVLSADPRTDLAAVQIPASRLFDLAWADSDNVQVGDPVMAVGNPFGYAGTISQGIISGKGRSRVRIENVDYQGFLQTDAVINPGNSGGPLVDMAGRIVGINTAIATQNGVFNGVGLAIPSNRVRDLLPTLISGEPIVRGYLGVVIVSVAEEPQLARFWGWTQDHGVLIQDVVDGAPAGGRLQPGDIITAVEGQPVRDTTQFTDRVALAVPGGDLQLELWRDRALEEVAVKVGPQPEGFSTRAFQTGRTRIDPLADAVSIPTLGISVAILDEALAKACDWSRAKLGSIIVTRVDPAGEAALRQVQTGDLIEEIQGAKPEDLPAAVELLSNPQSADGVVLQLRTPSGRRFVFLIPQ